MRSIYILPYRVSVTLLISLLLAAPVKAEVDIVANGALNFFFPHGAISVSLGQPVYLYGDRKIRRSSKHYHDHNYAYRNDSHRSYSNSYLIIQKPLKRSYKHYPYSHKQKHQAQYNNKGYKQQRRHNRWVEERRPIREKMYSKHERKHKKFRNKEYR